LLPNRWSGGRREETAWPGASCSDQRRRVLAGYRGGTAGVVGRKKRRWRVLEREEERSTGVGVGWERRRELGRGLEKE